MKYDENETSIQIESRKSMMRECTIGIDMYINKGKRIIYNHWQKMKRCDSAKFLCEMKWRD